jgi:hypothetical protein
MTHIPGYDAWVTRGPPEPPAPVVDTVEAGVTIDLPEGTLEPMGTFDADTGALISVSIAGRDVPASVIKAFVGPVEWARIEGLDDEELANLCLAAARDAADERGDWLREQRRDLE